MHRIAISLIFLVALSQSVCSQTNEGNEFWFGFMEHVDQNDNVKVAMITSKFNTSGTISIPNRNWSQSYQVAANQVQLITLPNYTENIGSEFINNVGVQVVSDLPVSVYIHQYHEYRSEATVVLPVTSLGMDYFVMTYDGVRNEGTDYPSEFLLVATEDETFIEINLSDLSKNGVGPNEAININLDKGETYQVQAANAQADLTGSFVKSDKKLAVFSGNVWTEVPTSCRARDNLLEQMYATDFWGKKIVTVPSEGTPYDIFRIMASEDFTKVSLIGPEPAINFTINRGQFYEVRLTSATLIDADKPIQIGQFLIGEGCSGNGIGDPSMVMLNSITQTRDTVTLFNSSLKDIRENYINILSLTSDVPLITIDGNPIPANAISGTVGVNNEFSYSTISVNAGAHTIISEGCGIIATAYGYGPAESYAYSGGASFNAINVNPIPDGGCLNDTVFFDANLPEERYSFIWDLGNDEIRTEKSFEKVYDELGSFTAELIIFDECAGTVDTFYKDLLISTRKAVESVGDTSLCSRGNIMLGATDVADAEYLWNGPNSFISEEQFPVIDNVGLENSGQYTVIGIVSGCATLPALMDIEVWPFPMPIFNQDSFFCGKNEEVVLYPGDFVSYQWEDNSEEDEKSVESGGLYSVLVTNEFGCEEFASISLTERCPTEIYVPNIFSPNEDGVNDEWQVYGQDVINFSIEVRNRWGELVFESKDINKSWDGRQFGANAVDGVYLYHIEIEGIRDDGITYNEVLAGSVTIVR